MPLAPQSGGFRSPCPRALGMPSALRIHPQRFPCRLCAMANSDDGESARNRAEINRQKSEAARAEAERRREKTEVDRIRAELLRVAEETDRRSSEKLRVIA